MFQSLLKTACIIPSMHCGSLCASRHLQETLHTGLSCRGSHRWGCKRFTRTEQELKKQQRWCCYVWRERRQAISSAGEEKDGGGGVLFCVILLALLHPSCLKGLINVHFYLAELHIKHMRLRCFSPLMGFQKMLMPDLWISHLSLCLHQGWRHSVFMWSVLLHSLARPSYSDRYDMALRGPPDWRRTWSELITHGPSHLQNKFVVRNQEIILQLWQDFTQTVLIVQDLWAMFVEGPCEKKYSFFAAHLKHCRSLVVDYYGLRCQSCLSCLRLYSDFAVRAHSKRPGTSLWQNV